MFCLSPFVLRTSSVSLESHSFSDTGIHLKSLQLQRVLGTVCTVGAMDVKKKAAKYSHREPEFGSLRFAVSGFKVWDSGYVSLFL